MKNDYIRELWGIFVAMAALTATSLPAKEPPVALPAKPDPWILLRPFVGQWEGEAHGEPGDGRSERAYAFVLQGRFLHITNRSVYPPQAKNPKGETHEDIGFMSFDKAAQKFILRQFHGEGFVNRYVLESVNEKDRTLVFVTTEIENIPAGWRGRETYRFVNDDEFIETFSLAAPGKNFTTYSEMHFRRKK